MKHYPPFVPAKAGTQCYRWKNGSKWPWVPACAGTNGEGLAERIYAMLVSKAGAAVQ
jgi:hypothetical protein